MLVPQALIPIVGGLFEYLEWSASWVESDLDDGRQIALLLQERLIMSECEGTLASELALLRECICRWVGLVEGGTSGYIPSAPPGWPEYDDTPVTIEEDVGPPPEGFDTWDEWRAYRCQAAQWWFTKTAQWIEQLHNVENTGQFITVGIATTILIALGITLPFAILVGVLGSIAIGITAAQLLAQRQWLDDNRDELICAIVTAGTVVQARNNLSAYIAAEWSALMGGSMLVELMLNYTWLNRVFESTMNSEDLSDYDPDACEDCGEVPGFICQSPVVPAGWYGDFLPGDGVISVGGGTWPDCTYPNAYSAILDQTLTGQHDIAMDATWYSGYGYGATCGNINLYGYRPDTQVWTLLCQYTAVTTDDAMTYYQLHHNPFGTVDLTPFTRYQIAITYQPGACRSAPALALNVTDVCFTLTAV